MSAIIIGGETTEPLLKDASKNLFLGLINFFKRRNIDPSYFWGQDCSQDKRGIDAYYTSKDDSWRILKYKTNTQRTVGSIEDLQDTFLHLHLGNQDTLFFPDSKSGIPVIDFYRKLARLCNNIKKRGLKID